MERIGECCGRGCGRNEWREAGVHPGHCLIGGRAEVTGADGTAPTPAEIAAVARSQNAENSAVGAPNVRESAQLSGERFKVTPTRAGQQGRWMSTGIAVGWMSGALLPMASGPEA